jgi:hypothetical protein
MNTRSLYVAMGISSLRNGVKLILAECLDGVKTIGTTLHDFASSSCPFYPHFFISDLSEPPQMQEASMWLWGLVACAMG